MKWLPNTRLLSTSEAEKAASSAYVWTRHCCCHLTSGSVRADTLRTSQSAALVSEDGKAGLRGKTRVRVLIFVAEGHNILGQLSRVEDMGEV